MKKIALTLIAVVLGIAGCTEEQEKGAGPSQKKVKLLGTTEAITDIRTRTQVGGMAQDGSLYMLWSAGDKVGVFSDVADVNVVFTSTNTQPVGTTAFEGILGGLPCYAYYPYAENSMDKTAIPVNIPTEQSYKDERSVSLYDIKASNSIVPQADGSYKLNLRQMASLVRFEINLSGVEGLILAEGETLKRLELGTETGDPLTGGYTMNLTNLDAGLTGGGTGVTAKALNLQFVNMPVLGDLAEPLIAYAIVVPGRQLNKEWECVIETSEHRIIFTTIVKCDLEAGKFHTIPLNALVLANAYYYDEAGTWMSGPKIEDVKEPGPDPAGSETANCYVVEAAGNYSFDATIIGNGTKGIIPNVGFHTTTASISPQSAKLLWQDIDGFITNVSLSAEGRVNYTAGKDTGNAMIAVYSGKDGTGSILWSWHIWGTGGEKLTDEVYTNKAGATFTVMDRTLGTHSKTSYYATLYQWGRKDPIPNSTTYYVDGAETDIEKSYPVYTDEVTIKASIKNPDKLLNANVTAGKWNWLSINNDYLWGDDNRKDLYTWFSDGKYSNPEAGAGWTNGKTIYDPCPVGYRVANKFTWTGFLKSTSGSNASTAAGSRLEYVNYTHYANGYYFMKNADDVTGTYYPMTGNRGGATGSLWAGSGKSAYTTLNYTAGYYSSAPQKNEHQAQILSINPYNAASSATESSRNSVDATGYSYKWAAYPVRCVREK